MILFALTILFGLASVIILAGAAAAARAERRWPGFSDLIDLPPAPASPPLTKRAASPKPRPILPKPSGALLSAGALRAAARLRQKIIE